MEQAVSEIIEDDGTCHGAGVAMSLVIQVAEPDDARAWSLLQRHSPGVALPNRTFVISKEAVHGLRRAGIRYRVLSDEGLLISP